MRTVVLSWALGLFVAANALVGPGETGASMTETGAPQATDSRDAGSDPTLLDADTSLPHALDSPHVEVEAREEAPRDGGLAPLLPAGPDESTPGPADAMDFLAPEEIPMHDESGTGAQERSDGQATRGLDPFGLVEIKPEPKPLALGTPKEPSRRDREPVEKPGRRVLATFAVLTAGAMALASWALSRHERSKTERPDEKPSSQGPTASHATTPAPGSGKPRVRSHGLRVPAQPAARHESSRARGRTRRSHRRRP